jgi:RNA polymerase sigma-70 factor, ECF subfamily
MTNDRDLFLKIQQGDKNSFEILFKTYYASLCHFSRNYIKDQDDCEEVVQGFFLKIWEKRAELDINTSVKNYLFSSIRNRCLNHIKHQKIKLNYQSEILSNPENTIDTSCFFLEIDLIEKIDKSIATLPNRRREIFLLSREQGLKYREIADQLGISIKTVETQMGQALKDLREKLKEYQNLLITFLWFQHQKSVRVTPSSVVNRVQANNETDGRR